MENCELVPGNLIRLVQLPVIEEQLKQVQKSVELRVKQAASMACSPETVTEVKKVRSELNKELQGLEELRKKVKSEVLRPYNAFEATYKECVLSQYKSGIEQLDIKVSDVEAGIKSKCRERLETYFTELVQLEGLQWLNFNQCGVVVDLTSAKQKTPKKLMEQVKAFVDRVALDIKAISQMPECDEILVEYKETLSLQSAIFTVKERHRKIEQQKSIRVAQEPVLQAQEAAVSEVLANAVSVVVCEEKPVEQPQEAQEFRSTFTVTATKEKLKKLKEFMIQEGIKYE